MALRSIDIQLPKGEEEEVKKIFTQFENSSVWEFQSAPEYFSARIILHAEETEKLMDILEKRYGGSERFRLILTSIEAVIPRRMKARPKSRRGSAGKSCITTSRTPANSTAFTRAWFFYRPLSPPSD